MKRLFAIVGLLFSLSVQAQLLPGILAGGSGGIDPNFSSVVLGLHLDGTNGGTTFTDIKSHTVTSAGGGSVTTDTGTKKFGTASGSFGGANWLTTADSNDWNFGSGDFTIGLWVYFTANPSSFGGDPGISLVHQGTTTAGASSFLLQVSGNLLSNCTLYARVYTNSGIITASAANQNLSLNTWYYFESDRVGNTLYLFLGGTSIATADVTGLTVNDSSAPLQFGAFNDVTFRYYLTGFEDDIEITKGVGRHSANFTPPTAAFPDS